MFKKLKQIASRYKQEIQLYQLVIADPRTPRLGKFFLVLAVGYFLLPFDLIPDFIPIIGHLDDLVIVPLFLWAAYELIPEKIIEEHRKKLRDPNHSNS